MNKRTALILLCSTVAWTSCYEGANDMAASNEQIVTFEISCNGLSQESMTRANTLTEPTQLLIFDCCNGSTTVTQKDAVTSVSMPLKDGTHDLYFMAASKACKSYDKDALTVSWPNNVSGYMSTVWACHYQIIVSEGTSFEEIELPLVVADVRVSSNDGLPTNLGKVSVEAPGVSTTLDLATMKAVAGEGVNFDIAVPASQYGKRFSLNIYTFVPEAGSVGDIAITMYDKTDNTTEISSRTLSAVPVTAGYVSDYTGYFFSSGISIPLSHTSDWLGRNEYDF